MRRVQELQWLLAFGAAVLWLRLGQLQGWQSQYWRARAQELRLLDEQVAARRGPILDRHGQVLADNVPTFRGQLLDGRSQALRAEAEEMGQMVPPLGARRHYPNGEAFCHVLGYLSENGGEDGLERTFQSQLAGQPGRARYLVTAQGRRLRRVEWSPPVAGQPLATHLDTSMQLAAYHALRSVMQQLGQVREAPDQPAGAVVAMGARSGRIRVLVSWPSFDLNRWSDPLQSRWRQKVLDSKESPLLNRAVAAQVAPASTFKVVTGSVAEVAPARIFDCRGVTWIGGTPFHCFERRGHGRLDFENCLAYSCDCAFYELGQELGAPALLEHARQLGLGRKLGIELPGEASGWLPPVREVDAGELANLSIGQGQLLVTPVQMAALMSIVPNQGRIARPHLVGPDLPLQKITGHNWARLAVGLQGALTHGTAAASGGSQLGLAGKTGTVENEPSASNPKGYNHTWFVGYWQPHSKQDEPLVVAVFLERSGGYGGGLAAPIAVSMLKAQ